jgi:hypothetical protein
LEEKCTAPAAGEETDADSTANWEKYHFPEDFRLSNEAIAGYIIGKTASLIYMQVKNSLTACKKEQHSSCG